MFVDKEPKCQRSDDVINLCVYHFKNVTVEQIENSFLIYLFSRDFQIIKIFTSHMFLYCLL